MSMPLAAASVLINLQDDTSDSIIAHTTGTYERLSEIMSHKQDMKMWRAGYISNHIWTRADFEADSSIDIWELNNPMGTRHSYQPSTEPNILHMWSHLHAVYTIYTSNITEKKQAGLWLTRWDRSLYICRLQPFSHNNHMIEIYLFRFIFDLCIVCSSGWNIWNVLELSEIHGRILLLKMSGCNLNFAISKTDLTLKETWQSILLLLFIVPFLFSLLVPVVANLCWLEYAAWCTFFDIKIAF